MVLLIIAGVLLIVLLLAAYYAYRMAFYVPMGYRDDALDLETSAKQLLADYTSYRTYFEYDIAPELPVAITYCFLTIMKEALANIVKHSNADTIALEHERLRGIYQETDWTMQLAYSGKMTHKAKRILFL